MVSVIVATIDRLAELDRLLASLEGQTQRAFEVIVVDQNPDDRLIAILRRHGSLVVRHLRSGRGLSRARNVGLRAAKGEIIAIPDDDCWYPKDLIARVTDWFKSHPEFDALLGIMRTSENKPILPRWAPGPGPCSKRNIWDCAVSNTTFLRRAVTDAVGFFDEDIGVGANTRFQSSEEIEYLLRALARGYRIWYEPHIAVYHPDMQSIDRLRKISYPYALGVGHTLRIHDFSWWSLSRFLIRSVGGAALSLCKGDLERTHLYLLRALGQFQGYFSTSGKGGRLAEPSSP